jgi:hypothetical protein
VDQIELKQVLNKRIVEKMAAKEYRATVLKPADTLDETVSVHQGIRQAEFVPSVLPTVRLSFSLRFYH